VADFIETLERAGQVVLGEENAISGLVRIAAPVDFFDRSAAYSIFEA
jgi:hypothetical protein